jgi:hypothetical protein
MIKAESFPLGDKEKAKGEIIKKDTVILSSDKTTTIKRLLVVQ